MVKDNINLYGIIPPIPTSFNGDGSIAHDQVRTNITFYNRFELKGYVILGSNGEFVLLDEDENISLIQTVRETMPSDKPLLAGVGCQSTGQTIRLCQKAASSGADVALVITPSYYKSKMSEAALSAFYKEVGDISPIPVILYNMPACTGIDLSVSIVVSLADHPNIIGIKDSSGNVTKMGEIVQRVPTDFQVLAGSAGFLLPALSIGADGGILALANIAPAQCIQIHQLFIEGRWKEAKLLQTSLISLNNAITRIGSVPALKCAMDHLGLYGGPVRGPLLPASTEEVQKVQALLKEAGINYIHN